jgi:hypothetical protein
MGKTFKLGNWDNPLTYLGDIIAAGENETPQRLPSGKSRQVITVNEDGDTLTYGPDGAGGNIIYLLAFTTEN